MEKSNKEHDGDDGILNSPSKKRKSIRNKGKSDTITDIHTALRTAQTSLDAELDKIEIQLESEVSAYESEYMKAFKVFMFVNV